MSIPPPLSKCHTCVTQVCYADVKPANFMLKSQFPMQGSTTGPDNVNTCVAMPPDIRVIDFGCSQHVVEGAKLAKRTGAV